MRRIALVTAASARHLDEDLPPLVEALRAVGVTGEPVVWDSPQARWDEYALAVVRSTWDYPPRRDEFLAWADRVAANIPLANPPDILRWNTDKRYLRELADAGIPVVPTRWIGPGEPVELPNEGDVVVKPSVSAGAKDTACHASRADAAAHVRGLQADGRTAMVQPYLHELDESGETGLIYIGGEFSHAIRKGAVLRPGTRYVEGLYAAEEICACEPTRRERELAERVLSRLPKLLYARVDLAPGPMLLELEVTEPSLFHAHGPGSAARFAAAISSLL